MRVATLNNYMILFREFRLSRHTDTMNKPIRLRKIDNEQHFKHENSRVVLLLTANPLPAFWLRGFLFKKELNIKLNIEFELLFYRCKKPGWKTTEPISLAWPFKHESSSTVRLSGLTPSRSLVKGFFVGNR